MHRRADAVKQTCRRCELRTFARSRTYGVTHRATYPRQLRPTSPSAHLGSFLLRQLHGTSCLRGPPAPPGRDRGPPSQEQTQTDFSKLDVLANSPSPATAIDMCLPDGFLLGNSLEVTGGTGCFLLNGEALLWRPWEAGTGGLINARGQWECGDKAWGALSLVWPKPDLLIVGTGAAIRPLSPRTRSYLNSLGVRIEVQDTRNAAAQFNMLATERGAGEVAAALIPMGRIDKA